MGTEWWTIGYTVAGVVLGAAASLIIRRFLPTRMGVSSSWWFSALVTGFLLGMLGWRIGDRGEVLIYGFVTVLGVPLAVIDWHEHRLPRVLVWPQLLGAAAGFAILCGLRSTPAPGLRAVAAAVAVAGAFLVLAIATAGGVGAGDVSLAGVIGLVAGWSSWASVAGALLVASLLGLALLAVPAARRRHEIDTVAVPFGPCLLVGAFLTVMLVG